MARERAVQLSSHEASGTEDFDDCGFGHLRLCLSYAGAGKQQQQGHGDLPPPTREDTGRGETRLAQEHVPHVGQCSLPQFACYARGAREVKNKRSIHGPSFLRGIPV